MQTIAVKFEDAALAASRSYEIRVGAGLLREAGPLIQGCGLTGKAAIVTDEVVARLYAESLKESLASSGFDAMIVQIPPGESQKSIETAGRIYSALTDFGAERSTPIIALGGGVVGDLAGFVAATYLRGVPFVQIPTTLLAQADSSIGGKVAVNHGALKNRIGAFYQPKITISDISTLKTLTPRELSDGLAEVIKYGIILDARLFEYLETNMVKIRGLDEECLEHIVTVSARAKAGIVEKDELDLGLRNILNYGHTVGHAIESVSGLEIWHGEAVAVGMVAEAVLASRLGILETSDVSRVRDLIAKAGLPHEMPRMSADLLIAAMRHDKKVAQGQLRFALPNGIGQAIIKGVDISQVSTFLSNSGK